MLGRLSLCVRFWLLANTLNTLNFPKPATDSSQRNQRGNSAVEIPSTDATSGTNGNYRNTGALIRWRPAT